MTNQEIIKEAYPKSWFKEINQLKKGFKTSDGKFSFTYLSRDKEALKKMKSLLEVFLNDRRIEKYLEVFQGDSGEFYGNIGFNEEITPELRKIGMKNKKKYHELSQLHTSVTECLEVHEIPFQTKIYYQEIDGKSTTAYNQRWRAYYIKNNELEEILIPDLFEWSDRHFLYVTNSSHDLNCSMSEIRGMDYEKMKKENEEEFKNHRNYEFFKHEQLRGSST